MNFLQKFFSRHFSDSNFNFTEYNAQGKSLELNYFLTVNSLFPFSS